jgi:hypothetical protein
MGHVADYLEVGTEVRLFLTCAIANSAAKVEVCAAETNCLAAGQVKGL